MNQKQKLLSLLKIKYPIIQGGMVWASGHELASAVSETGCLGVVGAGSMNPEILDLHLIKTKEKTNKPFAVNLPLLYSKIEEQIEVALKHNVKIFITSAGSPKKYTSYLKKQGAIVIHVTSTPELALKCEEAGVDAIVCEGVEAGGHNGRDEITTMCLIPQVARLVNIPIIAAGGIATGGAIAAAMSLGASGVQMGTRFLMTKESSAHENFKNEILKANATSTKLLLKDLVPVRLLDNPFSKEVIIKEDNCASKEELQNLLGKGRARSGIFEGDLIEGELEIGQICSLIKDIPSAQEVVVNLIQEYNQTIKNFTSL